MGCSLDIGTQEGAGNVLVRDFSLSVFGVLGHRLEAADKLRVGIIRVERHAGDVGFRKRVFCNLVQFMRLARARCAKKDEVAGVPRWLSFSFPRLEHLRGS